MLTNPAINIYTYINKLRYLYRNTDITLTYEYTPEMALRPAGIAQDRTTLRRDRGPTFEVTPNVEGAENL